MTRDDIIRMAREAGVKPLLYDGKWAVEGLDVFAALVAAANRKEYEMIRNDILLIANRMIEERGGAQIDDKEELLRFAVVLGNRVAAAEREAYVKELEAIANRIPAEQREGFVYMTVIECIAVIRARGEKK